MDTDGNPAKEVTENLANDDLDPNLIVVGIGASAGGVEALEMLFSAMPTDTGMAFVVAQHLSPDFPSLMPQILARKTSLDVVTITDQVRLRPNCVFVLPSGKDVLVDGDRLRTKDHERESRFEHPIDRFFSSLAKHHKENAVGIVLSGTGSDGSKGVVAISDNEGFVIVQSVASSKFNGMPRSAIAAGVADAISHVNNIPEVLIQYRELASCDRTRKSVYAESMNAEKRIYHLLNRKYGIDFDQYKPGLFGRRLSRRMMLGKVDSVESYQEILESDPKELAQLYNDLLIGVTEFFRDPDAFNELQHKVLPALMEDCVDQGNEFRVWIAPCATGEEAYSVAIVLDELNQQRGYGLDVKIFATDVNDNCITHASRGLFDIDRLTNVSTERLRKYFHRTDEGYSVDQRIRQQIVFAKHDLLNDAPFTKLDLACSRNFLIYLHAESKKKALSLLNFSLKPSGALFLGPSETCVDLESAFQPVCEKWRLYRKSSPVRFSQVKLPITSVNTTPTGRPALPSTTTTQRLDTETIYDDLLSEYMPPGLLVDHENRIVHIFGNATQFLSFQPGRPSQDLLELLPNSFRSAIKNGLKRSRQDGKTVVFPGLEMLVNDEIQQYQVSIKRVGIREPQLFLITIEEFASNHQQVHPCSDNSNDFSHIEIVRALEEELQDTRRSLQASILNLKSANEEMQTTNEELIASNEELQSTNEELHSVNEELYTVNSEHQRKIAELTELTDDMDNLLDSLHVDTIFLDRKLRVRKFTLGISNSFRLLPQDIGRDFESFNHDLNIKNLIESIRGVIDSEVAHEQEVQDHVGNWYLMRILPYSSKGTVDGALLTLIDIKKIKEAEARFKELSEIVSTSRDAIFRVTPEGMVQTWNQGAKELFQIESDQSIGKDLRELIPDETIASDFLEALGTLTQTQQLVRFEASFVRAYGVCLTFEAAVAPILDAENKLCGASFILRDITEQKRAQEEVKREVDRRDQFLAVLSHELRNPVAAVANAGSLLKHPDCSPHQLSKATDTIEANTRHLAKLLDDLLHVSRVRHNKLSLNMTQVDLVKCVEQVVQSLKFEFASKEQKLEVKLPDELHVTCDRTRIIQVVTNLIHNATKYTQVGGEIQVSLTQTDTTAVLEVQDNGEGIDPELAEQIFEVFVQTPQQLDRDRGGMGLGLPLVRMIADGHGGEISFNSPGIGDGSTFVFEIPLTQVAHSTGYECPLLSSPDARRSVPAENLLEGLQFLLIEDNQSIREMLAEYCALEDIDVVEASTGRMGIEQYRQHGPQICLVDIGLPDLNGYDVAKEIRKMDSQPELLVALTGYGQRKDRDHVLAAGFDLHFVKPIEPNDLLDALAAELERNQDANRHDLQSELDSRV